MQRVEAFVERILWNSRWMVMIAVIASIVMAFAVFVMATIDVLVVFRYLWAYVALPLSNPLGGDSTLSDTRASVSTALLTGVVKAIDGYLVAAILLIFALGLYEIFIGRIDIAHGSETATQLLNIHSIDDLKDRLAKSVVLALIVEYFRYALGTEIATALDLLFLAVGITLIGGAIYLTKDKHGTKQSGAVARPGGEPE